MSWSTNKNEGTIFIKSLCDVFNKAYENIPNNLSLAQMITQINEEVSNKNLQIAVPEFRMNREIKFSPKYVRKYLFIFIVDFYLKKQSRFGSVPFYYGEQWRSVTL